MRRTAFCLGLVFACNSDPGTDSGAGSEGTNGTATGGTATDASASDGTKTGTVSEDTAGSETMGTATAASGSSAESTGTVGVCGDFTLEGDEQCDEGPTPSGTNCTSGCTQAFTLRWEQSFAGQVDASADDVVLAGDGTIWVAGTESLGSGGQDCWLRQFSSEGDLLATHSVALDDEACSALAVHSSGDLIVAGRQNLGPGNPVDSDIFLARLTTEGTEIWLQTHNGPGDDYDDAEDVAIADDGTIWLVGGETGQGLDGLVLGYDSDGQLLVSAPVMGLYNLIDYLWAVAIASDGNVVVAGSAGFDPEPGAPGVFPFIQKIDQQSGEMIWQDHITEVGGYGQIRDLAVDAAGDVWAVGWRQDSQGNGHAWLFRYSDAGQGELGQEESGATWAGVFLAESGSVYVAGDIYDPATRANISLSEYDASGALGPRVLYNNYSANDHDWGYGIAGTNSGIFYVVGQSTGQGAWIGSYQRSP